MENKLGTTRPFNTHGGAMTLQMLIGWMAASIAGACCWKPALDALARRAGAHHP
jgi:hypothetical protein